MSKNLIVTYVFVIATVPAFIVFDVCPWIVSKLRRKDK